jgi:hypothetical protein
MFGSYPQGSGPLQNNMNPNNSMHSSAPNPLNYP